MAWPFLAALFLASPGPAPDRSFTLVLPVSPETAEGQRLIAARAGELCGTRYLELGRYRFSGTAEVGAGDPGRFEVTQEFACRDEPPPGPAAPARYDWSPTEADQRRVAELTARYFELVDRGDAGQVHALWVEGEQEAVPLDRRTVQLGEFRTQVGPPTGHRIAKITWYVNPDGMAGIFAAVDYERGYRNLVFNCGYVVWSRDPAGTYRLVREQTGSLARKDSAGLTDARLAEIRALMRCPSS